MGIGRLMILNVSPTRFLDEIRALDLVIANEIPGPLLFCGSWQTAVSALD
jgi:hypothetical protein